MSAGTSIKSVSWTPESLAIEWSEGPAAEFPSLWLRDNCPADRDPASGQRLVDISDIPPTPRLRAVRVEGDELTVEWEGEARAAAFSARWLANQRPIGPSNRPEFLPRLWLDGSTLQPTRRFAFRPYLELDRDATARLDWLMHVTRDGIAFVSGVPCSERAILAAAALIGMVAETNYGLLFDVRSVARPENLAYSDYGLGLHTDNPYRDPVPGFQALHVLIASPEGGDSLFADGFAIAEHLRESDPPAFERLSSTPVPFLYRSRDAELYAETPLIRLDAAGRVRAVHYNNRSIAPLRLPARELQLFYAAYRRLAELLREPRFQMRMKLAAGDLVVFDNQRTLHGRTAFTSARFPRHLQGCYLTRDSVFSRLGVLRRQLNPEACA